MKDDLLNSLLMITVEYEILMEQVTNIYQSKSHKKHSGNFSTTVKVKKVSISTQTITIDDNVDDQIETIKKLQETIKNTEPWFRNEFENDSDDDNDKDDDSTDSDSEADHSFWKRYLFIALDL